MNGGVDFTNVRRAAFYATPASPRTPAASTPTTATSYATGYATTPTPGCSTRTTTSFAFSRSSGSGGNVGNSGRKRSRISYDSRIPMSDRKKSDHSAANPAVYPHTPKASATAGRLDRGTWSTDLHHFNTEPLLARRETSRSHERGYATPGTVSPPPLANSRYYLATGYDTPTAAQANAYEDGAFFSYSASVNNNADSRFKRLADEGIGRHAYAFTAGLEGSVAEEVAGPLALGRNGNGGRDLRLRSTSSAQNSVQDQSVLYSSRLPLQSSIGGYGCDTAPWGVGKAILGAAAGVAGFVFHFCTAGAFRGFHAGGGPAWSIDANGEQCGSIAARPKQINEKSAQTEDSMASWHDSDFAQDDLPHSPSPRRAAKKMKINHEDDGGLKSSWIMVDSNEGSISGSPPRRNASTASPAGLRQRPKPGTHKRRFGGSMSGSLGVGMLENRAASSAALRSPRGPLARETLTPATARPKSSKEVAAADSPLGKEGEKLVRLQRRREREEERELTNMNRRLEEMIRQGREALGTRYEVELDDGVF